MTSLIVYHNRFIFLFGFNIFEMVSELQYFLVVTDKKQERQMSLKEYATGLTGSGKRQRKMKDRRGTRKKDNNK
jgi:hypothetical protein